MSDCVSSISEIIPGLYISSYKTACNQSVLKQFNIYAVISLGDTKEYCHYSNLSYMNIDINDDKNEDIQNISNPHMNSLTVLKVTF